MAKPRRSSGSRRASFAVAFWGSTQTTSTPEGFRKSTSQSSATSRVLNVRRRQSTSATSYWPAGSPQLQHQFDALGTGYDDSVLLRAACERDHRFNDAVACWNGTRKSHDVTI